jgi:hypothetical protein
VKVLASELRATEADGADWQRLHALIYEQWHARRPQFPDVETMAR